ncbi:3,4-dihydroxy-2-butanone-4-phosphate synthase [Craurococcus roseus]|uniref:3,4-dihydroxy-2-butanone 4-phosphate synthase n=1 Tax=Craurococcus roseus TaxID=77585 RepID=A0ABP3QSS1_9PROT
MSATPPPGATAEAPPQRVHFHDFVSPTEELLDEARSGRMFVLVDDEDRENEGDLVIPAQFATPEAINFMAKHARGLICLALTRGRVEKLGLPLMAQANGTRHQTAFTVSIEAREGVTTGISAADRAHTVAVAINPETGRDDIVTPGHVFPLVARDGGTLVRAGHTEAAVDFARLAGLNPSGVICEIMNDDGSMARMPDLVAFAQRHGLKLGTIADLIGHRRRTERLVRRVAEGHIDHAVGGEWHLVVYTSTLEYGEHLALVKGDVPGAAGDAPAMVRMHAANLLHDIIAGSGTGDLHSAMAMIAEAGRGVVVVIRDGRPTGVSEQVRLGGRDRRVVPPEIRDYGIGAQILADLGVRDMVRLSDNPRPIVGLEGYGLRVVETRPLRKGGPGA